MVWSQVMCECNGLLLFSLQFTEDCFVLRTPSDYDRHCSFLEGPLATDDSVTYGIKCRSPLNRIDNFHVANLMLPQDIMHILFEGVLAKETQLLLTRYICEAKYFSLDFLNSRMQSFVYGRVECRSKPPKAFTERHLTGTNKLPLSGVFTYTCTFILFLVHFLLSSTHSNSNVDIWHVTTIDDWG